MSSHSTSRFFHSLDREIEARLRSVGNSLEVEVGDLIVEEGNLDRSLFLVGRVLGPPARPRGQHPDRADHLRRCLR